MKKMTIGFTLLLIVAVAPFNSVIYAGSFRFIPLKIGQTFTFNVDDGVGNTWEQVGTVTGISFVPSMKHLYFKFEVSDNEEAKNLIFRSTHDEFFQYSNHTHYESIAWQDGPVGYCWTEQEPDGDNQKYCIEAKGVTITVPAGTFENCIQFRKCCENCGGGCGQDYWTEWVKPGFFLVKWIDTWGGEESVTYELKSYTK